MRFEKDKKIGDTIKMSIIVYVAFIGIALGLAARYCFAATPQYLMAAACFACGACMVYYLLRFIRYFKTWNNTYLQIESSSISGMAVNPKKGTGEPFEIGIQEVENVSLQKLKLTRRGLLPVLTIRTSSRAYYVFGIEDIKTARNTLAPKDEMY